MKRKLLILFISRSFHWILIVSLLVTPINNTYSEGILEAIGQGVQILQRNLGGGQRQQGRPSPASIQQALMNPRSPQNTIPDDLFPSCTVPKSSSPFPSNACQNAAPQNIPTAMTYQQVAANYISYYDEMMNTSANTQSPVGAACLTKGKDRAIKKINQKENELQIYINKIKAAQDKFKHETAQMTQQMAQLAYDLHGKQNSSLNSKISKDKIHVKQNNLTPQGCNDVFNADLKPELGLVNIQKSMSSFTDKSRQMIANRTLYERDVNRHIQMIRSEIKKKGIGGFKIEDLITRAKNDGLTQFSKIAYAYGRTKESIQEKLQEIGEFKNIRYKLPKLDENFQKEMQKFSQKSKEILEEQYIHTCVTKTNLSPGEIEKNLGNRNDRGGHAGTALWDYKKRLRTIFAEMAEGELISDKLDEIKRLDQQFVGQVVVRNFQDAATGRRQSILVSDLFKKSIETCQNRLSKGHDKSQNIHRSSVGQEIDNAAKKIKELKDLEQSFSNDMESTIKNHVLLCNNNAMPAGACNENSKLLATNSPSFCMNHAIQCATTVSSCYRKTEISVNNIKGQLESTAKLYDSKMNLAYQQQKAVLEDLKKDSINFAKYLKKYLPGVTYKHPTDLTLPLLKNKESAFGIPLAGGDDLEEHFKQLPNNINKLKKLLSRQRALATTKMTHHISSRTKLMNANKSKMAGVACQMSKNPQHF